MFNLKLRQKTAVLLGIVALSAVAITGCGKTKLSQETVAGVVKSYLTPKSEEEFTKAKEKYVKKKVLTEEVAEQLFDPSGFDFTPQDLQRQIDLTMYESRLNNFGTKEYIAQYTLYYSDGSSINQTAIFVTGTDGAIVKVLVEDID